MAFYPLEEHEYRYRPLGGSFTDWTPCTVKPIPVGDINIAAGDFQVRVKASGARPAGEVLSNDSAFTMVGTENATPAAPSYLTVNDVNDTAVFPVVSGYPNIADYEHQVNGGAYAALPGTSTINNGVITLNVGDIAIPIGSLLIRVKAGTTNNAGATVSNDTAFTVYVPDFVDITNAALSNNNTITVTANTNSTSPIEYSLDGLAGWQSSGVFSPVENATYDTITARLVGSSTVDVWGAAIIVNYADPADTAGHTTSGQAPCAGTDAVVDDTADTFAFTPGSDCGVVAPFDPNTVSAVQFRVKAAEGYTLAYENTTTTTTAITAGQSTFDIAATANIFEQGKIKIGTEEKIIVSRASFTVTVSTPFTNSYPSGTNVLRGRVSQLNDLKGGRNTIQATVASQPMWLNGSSLAVNNKPTIKFGVEALATTSNITLQDRVMFSVFKMLGASAGSYHTLITQNASPYYILGIKDGLLQVAIGSTWYNSGLTVNANTPYLAKAKIIGGTLTIKLNGVIGTGATGITTPSLTSTIWIGAAVNPNNGNFNGVESEAMLLDGTATETEENNIENYLKTEYGFTY